MLECRSKALIFPRSLRLLRRATRTWEPVLTAVCRTESGLWAEARGVRAGAGVYCGRARGKGLPLADLVLLEGADLGLVEFRLVRCCDLRAVGVYACVCV